MHRQREESVVYKVVVNHASQYSIWPMERANPLGWKDTGKSGSKADCLNYIKEIWANIRPTTYLRKKQESQ